MKHSSELITFLPGLTPSAPLHLWRCWLTIRALRAAPTWPWRQRWEEGCGRRSCGQPLWGATVWCRRLSWSPLEVWCSPARPQALLVLTPTHMPTSLTQEGALLPSHGDPPPPHSLGMGVGNGILPPLGNRGFNQLAIQSGEVCPPFFF